MDLPSPYRKITKSSLVEQHSITQKGFEEVLKRSVEIFGHVEKDMAPKLKEFWLKEMEILEEKQKVVKDTIKQHVKKAVDLEKELELSSRVNELNSDGPLVKIEEQVLELITEYEHLKMKRITEFDSLQSKEEELCQILREPRISRGERSYDSVSALPKMDQMEIFKARITQLEALKAELEHSFQSYKNKLNMLLEECGLPLFDDVKHFMKGNVAVNKTNLEKLKIIVKQCREKKHQMVKEADSLRSNITKLSHKIMKDPHHAAALISQLSGFKPLTIKKLKLQLKKLQEERNLEIKEIIENHQILLEEWWTKCCYSESQKADFFLNHVEVSLEEELKFLQFEIEKLQTLYNENKVIFELAKKYQDKWDYLLHIIDQMKNVDDRLKNRGGNLLQEEKQRKMLSKELPVIKAKLIQLLDKYKIKNCTDFLYYGTPLKTTLEEMETENGADKENDKLYREVAQVENAVTVCKLQYLPLSPSMRGMHSPQQQNTPNKLMHTTFTVCSLSTHTRYGYRVAVGGSHTGALAVGTIPSILVTPCTPEHRSPSETSSFGLRI